MDGAEHQMAGQGRLHADLRGLFVTDFPHHDHIRILAQERPQSAGKGQPDRGLDLDLIDPVQPVLHRIFDGHDVFRRRSNLIEGRV